MNANINNDEQWIYGYKAFYKGLVNSHNQSFELGKIYIDQNMDKNLGFHFCKNIEDIFVFPQFRENVFIYQVCCSGRIINYFNEYYGVYDVYAAEKMKIIKEISRKEIIQYYLSFSNTYRLDRLLRFIQLFSLTPEEVLLFRSEFEFKEIVMAYIDYYQEGDKEAFVKRKNLY